MPGPIARSMTEIGRAFATAGFALVGGHIRARIDYEQKVSTLRVLVGGEAQAYLDVADGDPAVALELASAGVTVADAAQLKAAGYRGPDIYRMHQYTEPLRRMQAMEVTDNPAQEPHTAPCAAVVRPAPAPPAAAPSSGLTSSPTSRPPPMLRVSTPDPYGRGAHTRPRPRTPHSATPSGHTSAPDACGSGQRRGRHE